MNRFSDGFSDNSYDSLLDEYAGESLGARSSKQNEKTEVTKKSTPVTQRPAPQKKPEFDIDISSKLKDIEIIENYTFFNNEHLSYFLEAYEIVNS